MNPADGDKTKVSVHMIGNAHIDLAWIWPWQDALQEVLSTCRSALDRLGEYPDFVFTHGDACTYEWIEKHDPDLLDEIKKYIRRGRWCVVGGWWCQPDCNLPSGESLVRQALYGKKYFKDKFNVDIRIGYNIDSFGHPGTLPQILKKSGFEFYVFRRPSRFEKNYPSQLFKWENVLKCDGDRGAEIVSFRITDVYSTEPSDDISEFINTATLDINTTVPKTMCFFGVGNHGGGPTKLEMEKIVELKNTSEDYQIKFSSPERFLRSLLPEELKALPVMRSSLQHYAVGCYSVVAELKKYNRMCESILIDAEKWSTIARFLMKSASAKDKIEEAWKNLLFNQFHDIIAGTSIPVVCEDAIQRAGSVLKESNEIRHEALRALSREITGSKYSIGKSLNYQSSVVVVFNSLSFQRDNLVEIEPWFGWEANNSGDVEITELDGKRLSIQEIPAESQKPEMRRFVFSAKVPSLGYRIYRLQLKSAENKERRTNHMDSKLKHGVIENKFYKLCFDRENGAVNEFLDKRTNTKVNSDLFAVPVVIDDKSDSWGHGVNAFNDKSAIFANPKYKLLERGPLRWALQVETRWNDSRVTQVFVWKKILS